jgi:hypothetical protein
MKLLSNLLTFSLIRRIQNGKLYRQGWLLRMVTKAVWWYSLYVLHSLVDSVCTTVPSFQLIHAHVGLVLVFAATPICDYLDVH